MFDLFRPDWGAAPPARSYVTIAWTARPGVETHHSVGLYGTTRAGSWMKTMQRDHLSRGWTDVFYNVGIYTDGVIVEGRPASAQSGPIKDLTVCFAGDYRTRELTDTQKQSWHKVRNYALAQGVGTRIVWHGQRDGSACPGTNVINWLKTLDEEAEMVDRNTDVGPSAVLADVFDKARTVGVFSEHTKAGSPVFSDELAAFLDRAGVLQPGSARTWTKKQITALIAAAAAGGATAAEVIEEIIRRLGG